MGDARTERWAAHRIQMRRQLVDSAMQAIDHIGPQISMREIAAEAKIPKPTLYRFFTDKSELVTGISDRVTETLTERIVTGPQLSANTLGELLRAAIAGYAEFIHDHPHIFRFLMLNSAPVASGDSGVSLATIENTRAMAADIAEILAPVIGTRDGSSDDDISTSVMIMGAVVFAAEQWIGDGHPTHPTDWFIDQVEPYIRGILHVTATQNGVDLDFDAPISDVIASVIDSYLNDAADD